MNKPDKFQLEIYKSLCNLGIPAHIKGYEFLKTAMKYIREHPNAIYSITKELYPGVAEIHGVQPEHVERGIRTAIAKIRANDATVYKVLGRVGPFTNSEFLATLGEAIKFKMAIEGDAS